jgi:multiple sugar transport system permease protein
MARVELSQVCKSFGAATILRDIDLTIAAGEFRIFRSIVLPILLPIMVTLATFTFLGTWNDFMWPLIVLSDDRLYTLPVALASLSREHVQDSELMMAGAVVTVVPVLLLFVVLQRYYIQGLLAGSVKG